MERLGHVVMSHFLGSGSGPVQVHIAREVSLRPIDLAWTLYLGV